MVWAAGLLEARVFTSSFRRACAATGVLALRQYRATAAAGPASATPSSAACTTVRVIATRVLAEAPGDGVTGSLGTLIQNDATASVSQEAVVYPATLTNYPSSVALGTARLSRRLRPTP
jgi:hypothetical protein